MANGYTDEEVQDVVDRLVRPGVRRPYDSLGVRRTDVTFDDVREAAAGVFLNYPKAVYAVVDLSRRRLLGALEAMNVLGGEVLSQVAVLRRRVLPVRDLSALSNARAALVELEGSVAGKPRDVRTLPAFVRFGTNVDRFLKKVGSNIKEAGAIVPTPGEARRSLPGKLTELEAACQAALEQAGLLAAAVGDYVKIGLPQLVARTVVSNARVVLEGRTADLEARSEQGRNEVLRQTVLELLAMKGVITKFGSFSPPTSAYSLEGAGGLFSDASRPAVPGRLEADNPGPYALVPGSTTASSTNVLRAYLDGASTGGAPSVQLFLPASQVPKIEGVAGGPFTIGLSNGQMLASVGGVDYPIELDGGTLTAADVASNITSGLGGSGFNGEAYFAPLMFDGGVAVSGNTFSPLVGTFPQNSINVGDEVDFYFGANAGVTRTVTGVTLTSGLPTLVTVGGGALASGTDQRVRYGSASRRVRIVPVDPLAAVQSRARIQLKCPTSVERDAGVTLGMFGELFGQGIPTDAKLVAQAVNAMPSNLRAEEYLRDATPATLRSDAANGRRIVAFEGAGQASWSGGVLSIITFQSTLPASVGSGDKIVLRLGIEKVGTILSRSGNSVTASFSPAVSPGSGFAETGSRAFALGDVVRITEGPNQGDYYVDALEAVPFQALMREYLPVPRDGADPVYFAGEVGRQGLRFSSKTPSLQGSVQVVDPLAVFFTSSPSALATASSVYVKLPSVPKDLEEGDTFELYESDVEVPSFSSPIVRDFGDGVIELGDALTVPQPVVFGGPPPFCRIRAGAVTTYDAFSEALELWAKPWDQGALRRYFVNFQRLLNPLLVNENPTDAQVGAAEQAIRVLLAAFTEAGASAQPGEPQPLERVLASYSASAEPAVDALYKTLREKGADRALDLLSACQFQTFFGLDQEETNYGTAMQKALREAMREDLPVRKVGRADTRRSLLKSTAASADFEYSSDDLDESPLPDPPITSE